MIVNLLKAAAQAHFAAPRQAARTMAARSERQYTQGERQYTQGKAVRTQGACIERLINDDFDDRMGLLYALTGDRQRPVSARQARLSTLQHQ